MFNKNYNLLTLLLVLFFYHANAQVGCNEGNFETFDLSGYSFQTATNGDTNGCGTTTINNLLNHTIPIIPPLGFPLNDTEESVSFVNNQQNEPTLAGFSIFHPQVYTGSNALRLNSRSTKTIEENTTVLTRDLGLITERYLTIDYSAVFHLPDHPHDPNFVKFSVVNKTTGVIVDEKCLDAFDTDGIDGISFSDDDLINVNNNVVSNTWRYNKWACLSFDLNNYVGKKSNLELIIIAADCGEALHDTLLYIDNICLQENPCECIDGNISMNAISENCPTEPFTVSGNYVLPSCEAVDPTEIILTLVPFNVNTGNSGTPILIDQNNFSNNGYSFSIDPSGLDTSLEYDIVGIANFSNGDSWSISNPGREITFIDCDEDPCIGRDCDDDDDDECSDYWVAILDEYIDGTQSGSNSVYLMANGNYPSGATYTWTTTRQSGLVQTYQSTTSNPRLVSASINNRIVSATVTVSYENCSETVNKVFDCAIPNNDANGNLFPECKNIGGGFGKKHEAIKIYPNPAKSESSVKIMGLEDYDINYIEVIDMFGNIKSTQKEKSNTIRLTNLKTGFYFIKISTKQGVIQKKIIIE